MLNNEGEKEPLIQVETRAGAADGEGTTHLMFGPGGELTRVPESDDNLVIWEQER
jgi:hypothetical protein